MSIRKNSKQWILIFLFTLLVISSFFFASSPDFLQPPDLTNHSLSFLCGLFAIFIAWQLVPFYKLDTHSASPVSQPFNAVLLFVFALVMRIAFLQSVPPALWYDEANHALDAILMMETGNFPLYFKSNCGQEPIFKYLTMLSMQIFGNTALAVRMVSAVIGALTMVIGFIWLRLHFSSRIAFLSSALLCTTPWHLQFSRIGFRGILVPFFIVLSLYLVDRAQISGKKSHYFLTGIVMGAGLYSYVAFRLVPLYVIVYVVLTRNQSISIRTHFKSAAIGIFGFMMMVSPLIVYSFIHPELFTARMRLTSVFSSSGSSLENLFYNLHKHLLLPVTGGDPILRHGLPGRAPLSYLGSLLFILGLGVILRNCSKRFGISALIFYFGMLIPGILSVPVQAPATLRSLGAFPGVMIVVTCGLSLLYRLTIRWKLIPLLILLLFLGVIDNLFRFYTIYPATFVKLPRSERSEFGFNTDEYMLAEFLNTQDTNKYDIYLSPQLRFHPTVRFLTWKQTLYKGIYRPEYFKYMESHGRDLRVILNLKPRNIWWLRDNPNKNFFHFWLMNEGLDYNEIKAMISYCYPQDGYLMRTSDKLILDHLKSMYPEGQLIETEHYAVYDVNAQHRNERFIE